MFCKPGECTPRFNLFLGDPKADLPAMMTATNMDSTIALPYLSHINVFDQKCTSCIDNVLTDSVPTPVIGG